MEEGASNLKIRAILYDESDLIIRKEELLLPIQHLHPGESFPITLSFPKSPEVDQIEIDVLSYQISLNPDVELEVEITDRNTSGDGSYVLAGWLSNPRNIGVQIHNFSLVSQKTMDPFTLSLPLRFTIIPFSPPREFPS